MIEMAVCDHHDVDVLWRDSSRRELRTQSAARPAEGVLARSEPGVHEDDCVRADREEAVVRHVLGRRARQQARKL